MVQDESWNGNPLNKTGWKLVVSMDPDKNLYIENKGERLGKEIT